MVRAGGERPLDYKSGKPFGYRGAWMAVGLAQLALEFGIAPEFPDRTALIDAVTAAAAARGMPILIRASNAQDASRNRLRRNALLRELGAALVRLESTPAA